MSFWNYSSFSWGLSRLESYQESLADLSPAQQQQIEERLREKARQSGQRGYLGDEAEGILNRLMKWADEQMAQGLPLHVEEVKIYPEQMPLDTLQFTERLGYRKDNAIKMLTMGCYNTLWALREHLEKHPKSLGELDQKVLALVRKWMGFRELPKNPAEREALHQGWRCQREMCSFHALHCPHGANNPSGQ
jgi:hypothetical protein